MKTTKETLKKIIQEEIGKVMEEEETEYLADMFNMVFDPLKQLAEELEKTNDFRSDPIRDIIDHLRREGKRLFP
jgi:predicted house-cleaning noncanonical NTP pyrophosphatase (MazG superfamily)